MKYTYAYKTSDGTRHEASVEADSRDAAFGMLRKRGIRAIKVVAADGSRANGEVRGVRKRVVVAIAVAVALATGMAVFFAGRSDGQAAVGTSEARSLERQALSGSRDRIDEAYKTAFANRAEAFLARFAEPGQPFSAPESEWPGKADFEEVLNRPILVSADEFTESIDLKRIVVGMKREMSAYLRGGGLVSGYIRELIKRQQTEISYRENAEKKLRELLAPPSMGSNAAGGGVARDKQLKSAYGFWLKANAQLQAMGISPLPIPARLRDQQLKEGFGE